MLHVNATHMRTPHQTNTYYKPHSTTRSRVEIIIHYYILTFSTLAFGFLKLVACEVYGIQKTSDTGISCGHCSVPVVVLLRAVICTKPNKALQNTIPHQSHHLHHHTWLTKKKIQVLVCEINEKHDTLSVCRALDFCRTVWLITVELYVRMCISFRTHLVICLQAREHELVEAGICTDIVAVSLCERVTRMYVNVKLFSF